MINGYPLAAAAVFFLLALARWRYGKTHKPPYWLLCISGFLASLGVPVWYQALGSLAANRAGLFGLVVATMAAGVMFYHEGIRARNRHHVRTPIIGLVFGTALLVTISSFTRIVHQAANMPAGTSHALASAMTSIQSAHAGQLSLAHYGPILGGGLFVFVAVGFIAHRLAKGGKSGSRGPARGSGAAPSLGGGSGRPPSALSPGRRK